MPNNENIVVDSSLISIIENLGSIMCTLKEVSYVVGIGATQLSNIREYAEALERGKARGRESLRRAQFRKAVDDGNVNMLIWLGKQYLNQRDRIVEDIDEMPARKIRITFGDDGVSRN